MSEQVQEAVIRMKFEQGPDGAKQLKEMGGHAKTLAKTEDDFEKAVAKATKSLKDREQTLRAIAEAQRRMGAIQLTDEQKYQREVQKTTELIKQRARMQADVARTLQGQGLDASGRAIPKGPGMLQRDIGGSVRSLAGGNFAEMIPQLAIAGAIAAAIGRGIDMAVSHSAREMNRGLTAGQRNAAGIRELPFGGTAMDWVSRGSGNAESLRYGAETAPQFQLASDIRLENAQRGYSKEVEISGAQARAAAMRNAPLPVYPGFDLSSVSGASAAKEYGLRRPGMEAVARAKGDLLAAQGGIGAYHQNEAAAKAQLDAAIANMRSSKSNAERARHNAPRDEEEFDRSTRALHLLRITDPTGNLTALARHHVKGAFGWESGGQANLVGAEQAHQNASAEVEKLQAEYAKRKLETHEKTVQMVELENRLARANLETSKGELAVLQSRAQVMSSTGIGLTALGKGGRMQGLAAAQFISKHGLDAATPEIMSAARGFDPTWFEKQAERFGQSTEEGNAWRRFAGREAFGGAFTEGGLEANRARQQELQMKVDLQVNINEETLAERIAEAFVRKWGNVHGLIESVQARVERLESGIKIQAAQGRQ